MNAVSKHTNILCLYVLLTVLVFGPAVYAVESLKVFILAGQSNMEGHGKSEFGMNPDYPQDPVKYIIGGLGSLRHMAVNDTDGVPPHYRDLLVNPSDPVNSDWKTRSDVKVWYRHDDLTDTPNVKKGDLGIGFGGDIGPEYGFGWVIGDYFDEPVLIIKTAWGGKSLKTDFRPPSAVAARGGVVGPYYLGMLDYVHEVLDNLGTEFPEYASMDYQIAGFGWHQGYNDKGSTEYEANMENFIKDVREALGVPNLPFAIATTGMLGGSTVTIVEEAQLAMADYDKYPEFEGNVVVDDTYPYWRDASVSPSGFGYHWNHNGETHFLIGDAMGHGMIDLLALVDPNAPVVHAGDDKITWSGEIVLMDPNVVERAGSDWTNLTYKWTAKPETGVLFSDVTIEAPTVTITKPTGNPSKVTLTLEVNNSGRTATGVKNTITIDVYDDACKAAIIGKGFSADHPTDIDGNCITNLPDFAELALQWLYDEVSTVAIRKD